MRTTKMLVVLSALVTLCAGGKALAAGVGGNPNGKPFIRIQGQIVEVEGKIASLQDQIDALVRRVDTVEERLVADQEAILNLQGQNAELQSQLATYGTDLNAVNARIAVLEAESETLNSRIAAGEKDLKSLQAQLDYNSGLILQLQQTASSLTTLQDQVANNSALIAGLEDEVGIINERLALKQDIVDQKCPAGQAVQEVRADGSVACVAVGAAPQAISVYQVYKSVAVAKGSSGFVDVLCTLGDTVTGGGYAGGWSWNGIVVSESRPINLVPSWGWTVKGKNNGSFDDSLIGYARCLHIQ
jgi:predicted  nucleic acid-binding Zn-ribbon protein